MSLVVFDPIKALIAEVQARDSSLEFDHTTLEGEKELRSWVRSVRSDRADLEKIRVIAKKDALEYGQKVDSYAKELKAPFDKIITERMKPLDEIEATKLKLAEEIVETERVAKEKAETERLAELKRREDAVSAKEAEQTAKATAAKVEADKAAVVKTAQEQAERDKVAVAAKVEQDKKDALEEAGREKQKALDKAEADRQAAIDAEHEKASLAKRIRQYKFDADQAENKRLADIEAKRVADTEHRSKIHGQIEAFLRDYVLDTEASIITEELINGNIPNVKIIY